MSLENNDAGRPDCRSPPVMATDGAPEHRTAFHQPNQTPRVISIQSHVVHGYVGQKACTFPLQLLGFDVDAVNTVQFSNHTAYRHVSGQRATAEHLRELLCGGLMPNHLLHGVQHVLTGYMRSADWADAVLELLQRIREANAEDVRNQDGVHTSEEASTLRYVCDPVLGDAGRLYVPEEMIAVYRDRLAPHAYLLTPNAFELQCLANGESDVERACDWLHRERGVPHIVVTSCPPPQITSPSSQCPPEVILLSTGTAEPKQWFRLPRRFPMQFTGSGDLTAALLLAWTHRTGSVSKAVPIAMSSVYHVLRRTFECGRVVQPGLAPELCLIESRDDLCRPEMVCQRVYI